MTKKKKKICWEDEYHYFSAAFFVGSLCSLIVMFIKPGNIQTLMLALMAVVANHLYSSKLWESQERDFHRWLILISSATAFFGLVLKFKDYYVKVYNKNI